jgi:hypothetical protein
MVSGLEKQLFFQKWLASKPTTSGRKVVFPDLTP